MPTVVAPMAAFLVATLAVAALVPLLQPAVAAPLDTHVLRFEAMPDFINLNKTTTIEVEIGTSYGAGEDNYRATVIAPDSSEWSAWYNFTEIGALGMEFGNVTSGFMAAVTQVGSYDLFLEHFNGTAYNAAAFAQFLVTDRLKIVLEAATASNEFTDVHNCPIAQEFQRGGEIIARAYVTYASTGEYVDPAVVPSAEGNITGTLLGETKVLRWQSTYKFWRWAWFPMWNATTGAIVFTVDASDGLGNVGSVASPDSGLTAWKITPAILKVVTRLFNETGEETALFRPGETVTIEATVTYEGHNAHNFDFPGPLTHERGGQVEATLGWGSFDNAMGIYENYLANLTLSLDETTEKWYGTYSVPAGFPNTTDMQARVFAFDSNSPANAGSAFTSRFAVKQLPEPVEVPVEVPVSTGFELPVVVGLAVGLLVAGVAVGAFLYRLKQPGPPGGKGPEDGGEEP